MLQSIRRHFLPKDETLVGSLCLLVSFPNIDGISRNRYQEKNFDGRAKKARVVGYLVGK
jgi:hypothetical protein